MRKLFIFSVLLVLVAALQGGASPIVQVAALPLIAPVAVCHPAVPCVAPGCVPGPTSLVPCDPNVITPRGFESPGGNCGTKRTLVFDIPATVWSAFVSAHGRLAWSVTPSLAQ